VTSTLESVTLPLESMPPHPSSRGFGQKSYCMDASFPIVDLSSRQSMVCMLPGGPVFHAEGLDRAPAAAAFGQVSVNVRQ